MFARMASPRRIVVIGGGVAGLCAAVYALRCGYEVDVLEQHDGSGGLATSWQRQGYTFETCLHWLLGSSPVSPLHAMWQEVCDLDRLQFIYPPDIVRLEDEHGESLAIPSSVERMQAELIERSPRDAEPIRRLSADVRRLARLRLPDPSEQGPRAWLGLVRLWPELELLRRWSRTTLAEYARRFEHPLLRAFFESGSMGQSSALPVAFALAWLSARQAGYPIGGSQAVIRLIVERLKQLGGRLRLGTAVKRVMVEHDAAVGVQLRDGASLPADAVISAADGHATVYELLGGRYTDAASDARYARCPTYPSYLQVSLGVGADLSEWPAHGTRVLDVPLALDPQTSLAQLSWRCFHFDPTFAPAHRTALTCVLPTYDVGYWTGLRQRNAEAYRAEKARVSRSVIDILERARPGMRSAIEVIDVSTPATVVRITGNWRGSMQGWLLMPDTALETPSNRLPGLRRFYMAGQWIAPGGGLPGGLMSARAAVRALCRDDRTPFIVTPPGPARSAADRYL